MDSFTLNKIAGGVLATALFVMVVKIGAEAIFEPEAPEEPAYVVEGVDEEEAPAEEAAAPEMVLPDFASAIPAADLANGELVAERCALCHNWISGGGNMIGPNLYGVVGRAKASTDFGYSPALQNLGGEWTYGDLFQFVQQPAVFAPGTIMGFAGLDREQDRIDLIAYMRTWADTPAPLPPPMPAAEPEEEAEDAPE
jgi:cytochrome c